MAEPGVIDAYLHRLRTGLAGLPDCEDSVAEAEDHLREAAAHLVGSGMAAADAETEAVRHFGSAALVTHAHVVDHRKGSAVATTFTRRAGLAGALLFPILALAVFLEALDLPKSPLPLRSVPAWLAAAGAASFGVAFAGLAQRHRGALGGWGRAARIVAVLAVPLSIPFGWAAGAALMGWMAIAATLLAIGMFSIGVLPRLPLAVLAAGPPLLLAFLGVGTLAEKNMGGGTAASITEIGLVVLVAAVSRLGFLMWREPAVEDRRRTPGPLATA